MAAAEQTLEVNETPKPSRLAAIVNTTGERIPLLDANGDETGIFVNLEPFDGEARLKWDNKIRAASILKGKKRDDEILKSYVWLWNLKVGAIEGVPSDDPMLGGKEPKAWFTSNGDGLVWVKTVIDEYYARQNPKAGEGKN